MKDKKTVRKSLPVLLAISMVLVAGCSSKSADGTNSSSPTNTTAATAAVSVAPSAAATAAPKTPITLKVEFNSADAAFPNSDVYNEITKQTGVTMNIEPYDQKKFQVEMAGGDLPDIIQVPNSGDHTYLDQLIEGKNIIPLDDLVKSNGPDIQKPVYAKSLDYSKKFWGHNTGKLYVIPVQIGPSGWGFDQQTGITVRWDYYKELGYPVLKNMDDVVNMYAAMVKNHPTANGKKAYGYSIWNDWGTWGLTGTGLVTGNGMFDVNTQQVENNYTDPAHSSFWDSASLLYKMQQKGILDPDGFVNKYADLVAKSTQGIMLGSIATWQYNEAANGELLKQAPDAGYVTIPLDWGFANVGGSTIAGWNDKAFAISANCKDPQRAMDLINFLVSEQGSRLIQSGVKGVNWDIVDGKPQMKAETIALKKAGGDAWKKTGINLIANQQGLSDFSVLSDGGPVNLFDTPEVFATQVNSLNKDYDNHYGVTYPAAAYKKYADAGKIKTNDQMPLDVLSAMAAPSDDIKRISAKLDDLMTKGIPTVVLKSKNDAEYLANQKDLIAKLNDAGADKYFQWYKKAFEDAKAKFN